jgi:glyoxylase-like metal-dependent hydrolase (beta-lactamase superfamily II)
MSAGGVLSRVAPGIYCVLRRSYFSCSYIVVRTEDIVFIDAGMRSDAGDMIHALYELSLDLPVRAVLLTHWHNDHSAGARRMQECGSKIYAAPGEFPFLSGESSQGLSGRLADLIPEWGPLILGKGLLGNRVMLPFQPDSSIEDGEIIERDFQVVMTPGHTAGHAAYFHLPSKTLFCGDAVAVIRGKIRFMARPVTPDIAAARESMQRIAALPFETLCPGHRGPLLNVTAEQRDTLAQQVESGRWPLFG